MLSSDCKGKVVDSHAPTSSRSVGVFRSVLVAGALACAVCSSGAAFAQETPDSAPEGVEETAPASPDLQRELQTVEQEVDQLKERVFRSKATLQLLRELVSAGIASGSRVALYHVNRLGSAYRMESVQYLLDGKSVYSKVDPGGSLDTLREFQVHDQALPPGTHSVQVNMVLRGKGFGVFSYLRTYQFKVQSSYSFTVEEGRLSLIRVVTDAKGGLKNFVERPTVQYEAKTESLQSE